MANTDTMTMKDYLNQDADADATTAKPPKPPTQIIINPCPINPNQNTITMDRSESIYLRMKILTVALGTIIMGVGCHAHFYSEWNARYIHGTEEYAATLEDVFISFLILTYMISIGNLFLTFDVTYKKGQYTHILKWEKVYHITASIFLLILGALHMFSATVVLKRNMKELKARISIENTIRNYEQLYDAKIAAGSLCMINACLYFATPFCAPKIHPHAN